MASIIKVGEKWRVLSQRRGCPSYCKTFLTKAWARQIEAGIDQGPSLQPAAVLGRALLLREAIAAYRDLRDSTPPISDSSNEHDMLNHLGAPAA